MHNKSLDFMFRALIVAAACFGWAVAAFAQSGDKPKIAVYVVGNRDVHKVLTTRLLEAFVNSRRYTAVERSDAFVAEINREQRVQRSGAIDDEQISRLGRQSGVQFVCVADITSALGSNQISARIIDVETADVVAMGVADSPLGTMEDLTMVAQRIVAAMFRGGADDPHKRHNTLASGEVHSPPPPPAYFLTISVDPPGGGTVFRVPDQKRYAAGTQVTATAVPAAGYAFAGWTGAVVSENPKVTGPMTRDLIMTANFRESPNQLEHSEYSEYPIYYETFTTEERWKTWTYNWLVPGLGSGLVMGDKVGAWTQALLTVGGLALFISDMNLSDDRSESRIGTTGYIGYSMLIGSGVFNIARSVTYKRPVYDTDTGKKPRKPKATSSRN